MKYLKLFEEKEEFKMLEELKEIFYILQDEGINIRMETRQDTSDTWGVDWISTAENEKFSYGTDYRLYITPPRSRKKPNSQVGRLVTIPLINTVKKTFPETSHYLEFLDRCQEICEKNDYILEVYDGDNEIGHEPDVIFEMTPIVGMPTKNSKSPR